MNQNANFQEGPPPPGEMPFHGSETLLPPPPPPRQVSVRLPARFPWVTYTLIALTTLVFLAQKGSTFLVGYDVPALLGMKINEHIFRGELWRLFTPLLLHGSILHIGFNMYALYILGPELERNSGYGRFLTLYLLSGFAGNVGSLLFSTAPSLGASTAIFGLLGAQGVFVYQNRQLLGKRAQMVLNQIVILAVINLVIGLSPGIDNWGHMGGLLGGVLFSWFAGPIFRIEGISGSYSLADRREPGKVTLAAVGVGLLFSFVAAIAIFFQV